jgi:hypothetical protein
LQGPRCCEGGGPVGAVVVVPGRPVHSLDRNKREKKNKKRKKTHFPTTDTVSQVVGRRRGGGCVRAVVVVAGCGCGVPSVFIR